MGSWSASKKPCAVSEPSVGKLLFCFTNASALTNLFTRFISDNKVDNWLMQSSTICLVASENQTEREIYGSFESKSSANDLRIKFVKYLKFGLQSSRFRGNCHEIV